MRVWFGCSTWNIHKVRFFFQVSVPAALNAALKVKGTLGPSIAALQFSVKGKDLSAEGMV